MWFKIDLAMVLNYHLLSPSKGMMFPAKQGNCFFLDSYFERRL